VPAGTASRGRRQSESSGTKSGYRGLLQDPWLGYGWNFEYSLIVAAITLVAAVLAVRFFRWE